jgi:endonuclease YncB( thermonuclease family)
MRCRSWAARLGLIVLSLAAPATQSYRLSSYAFVNEDGSLTIKGRTVYLYGVYVPPTARTCRPDFRPPLCAPRASLLLELKIGSDFVACDPVRANADGTYTGLCRVRGEDLAAYLLSEGWALALPDAPFEYVALERIARNRGLGVWGIPLDGIQRRW